MTDVSAELGEPSTPVEAPRLRWWRELAIGAAVYFVYSVVRNQFGSAGGDPGPAFGHAQDIIRIERDLHLFFEAHVQRWYLDLPGHGLIRLWNVYYGIAHFLVTFVVLVVLFRKAPERYPRMRNALALTTCLAVVGFAAYSLMPPRLLDDPHDYGGCQVYAPQEAARASDGAPLPGDCDRYGFVDSVDRYGGWISFQNEGYKDVSNQYAAMPSMHIGWSTWCAIGLVPLVRRRWAKVLAALYPVITLTCIVLTANHYWIDGVGGLVTLSAGFGLATLITGRRILPRRATPAPTT